VVFAPVDLYLTRFGYALSILSMSNVANKTTLRFEVQSKSPTHSYSIWATVAESHTEAEQIVRDRLSASKRYNKERVMKGSAKIVPGALDINGARLIDAGLWTDWAD
jgi:hypothetical protein